MTKQELRRVMSWLGRKSYQVRLRRFGLERLRAHAREIGKLGGRPKGSGKKKAGGR